MSGNAWLRSALVAASLLCVVAGPAAAWDETVHRAVARVAQENLSPQAERRHRFLMGTGAKLEDVAAWADQIIAERPETEAWHSIPIPPVATEIDLDRDCPVGDCAPVKVRETLGIVRLAFKDKAEIIEAFKFLINLTTDMHQPLNAGYPPGSGGDAVMVVFEGRTMRLREFWDGEVFGDADPDALAARIRELITPERTREWTRGTIRDWAWDTHLTAIRVAYGGLPSGSPKQLDADYLSHARTSADMQLAKAAVRVAALLNEAWLQ